jgi:acetoin utilization deacetylase AcuC-like enzyme
MAPSVGRPLALVDDPLFAEHRGRGYHPERPERLVAAKQALRLAGERGLGATVLAPRDATLDELARVHTSRYLDELEQLRGGHAALDDDTFLGPRSVEAAYRAAGGGLALVDALLDGHASLGLALVRPPGHHATPDRGMGFCLLNNVATAAAHARSRGVRRVAILDWDVHHGNGTEAAFLHDPSVLFVSVHQHPFYPGTGSASDRGHGEGEGYTVNVPLSTGGDDATYARVFDRLVGPVLDAYAPELVLVSAGFDAHARDPLAGMALSANGFAAMSHVVRDIAARHASGRIGVFLEGGYDLEGLETSLLSTLLALAGLAEPRSPAPRPPTPALLDPSLADRDLAVALAEARRTWKFA